MSGKKETTSTTASASASASAESFGQRLASAAMSAIQVVARSFNPREEEDMDLEKQRLLERIATFEHMPELEQPTLIKDRQEFLSAISELERKQYHLEYHRLDDGQTLVMCKNTEHPHLECYYLEEKAEGGASTYSSYTTLDRLMVHAIHQSFSESALHTLHGLLKRHIRDMKDRFSMLKETSLQEDAAQAARMSFDALIAPRGPILSPFSILITALHRGQFEITTNCILELQATPFSFHLDLIRMGFMRLCAIEEGARIVDASGKLDHISLTAQAKANREYMEPIHDLLAEQLGKILYYYMDLTYTSSAELIAMDPSLAEANALEERRGMVFNTLCLLDDMLSHDRSAYASDPHASPEILMRVTPPSSLAGIIPFHSDLMARAHYQAFEILVLKFSSITEKEWDAEAVKAFKAITIQKVGHLLREIPVDSDTFQQCFVAMLRSSAPSSMHTLLLPHKNLLLAAYEHKALTDADFFGAPDPRDPRLYRSSPIFHLLEQARERHHFEEVTQVIIAKKDQIKASKGMLESGLAYGFYLFLLPLEIMDERKQQDASQFLSMWLGLLSHAYESHPLCCMKASVFLREQEDPNPEYRARLLSLFDVLQTLKVPFPFTPTQLALIERARQETAKREAIRLEIKEAIKPDPSPPATGSLVVFSHRSVTQPDPAASKDAHAPKNQDASGNHGL